MKIQILSEGAPTALSRQTDDQPRFEHRERERERERERSRGVLLHSESRFQLFPSLKRERVSRTRKGETALVHEPYIDRVEIRCETRRASRDTLEKKLKGILNGGLSQRLAARHQVEELLDVLRWRSRRRDRVAYTQLDLWVRG